MWGIGYPQRRSARTFTSVSVDFDPLKHLHALLDQLLGQNTVAYSEDCYWVIVPLLFKKFKSGLDTGKNSLTPICVSTI